MTHALWKWVTHLQVSWTYSDSRHDRPWGSQASYKRQSARHHHRRNIHPLAPWWPPTGSCASPQPSFSVSAPCRQMRVDSEETVVSHWEHNFNPEYTFTTTYNTPSMPYLWSDTKESTAVGRSTFTHRLPITKTLQVIVKSEFNTWEQPTNLLNKHSPLSITILSRFKLTCRNVLQCKQPYSGVSIHRPLLRLTVRLAAMVHKAWLVSLRPGIYDPILHIHRKQSPVSR